jgi:hypothetical protein
MSGPEQTTDSAELVITSDILDADLRSACIHEAAHAVVAQHLGVSAMAEVFPSGAFDLIHEKYWIGKTRLYPSPTGRARVLIGLAGSVAEALQDDPEWFEMNPEDFELSYELSQTDADFVGNFTTADVEETAAILKSIWPTVEREAGYLVAKVRS